MLPEESCEDTGAHSRYAHGGAHPVGEEDAEGQWQKDTTAPECHGQIVPF